MATKKEDGVAAEIEKAAEAIFNAEYLLIVAGPLFDTTTRSPFASEYCDPGVVAHPNKFMGFWGGYLNEYSERAPHDGFSILSRWRDKFFCSDDVRRRQNKKRNEDEGEGDSIPKCMVYTGHIGNLFQRIGFPNDEVYEANGSIVAWQCSKVPPCCPRIQSIDRNFRFVIDGTNKEALPVKYVPDRRDTKPPIKPVLVQSDDEDFEFLEADPKKVLDAAKHAKEEQFKRLQRRLGFGRVIRIVQPLQVGADRFPDLFTGYCRTTGDKVTSFTFTDAPEDPQALRRPEAILDHTETRNGDEGGRVHQPVATEALSHPTRCSHLLQHVRALDIHAEDEKMGVFSGCEPEKWQRDRDQHYQTLVKVFMADCHSIAMKRSKFISYNISMVIVTDNEHDNVTNGGVARSHVLPSHLREKLLQVYPSTSDTSKSVNVVSETGGDVLGALDPKQAAVGELLENEHRHWEQGKNGWYYFSHVIGRHTTQEPVKNGFSDVVHIPFPVDADGNPTVKIPTMDARVSIVCETVIHWDGIEPEKQQSKPAARPPGSHPYVYTANVWQLTGKLSNPGGKLFANPTEFKGKDSLEYVLESRKRHVIKLGTKKDEPSSCTYLQIEIPVDENFAEPNQSHCSHVNTLKSSDSSASSRPESVTSFMQNLRTREVERRPAVPTPNHILCQHCHGIARPFVNMARPGVKDEGFCQSVLLQRTRVFKGWEKSMIDSIKQDQNRSVVLLELGADKKADVAKQYAEKTFKSLKSSRCTMVRITPLDIEPKKKSPGGAQEAANYVVVQANIVQALTQIERAISEKMRKKGGG